MSDLLFQNLSTVQSNQQPTPTTIASAATLAPVNFLTLVTGTVVTATITPPVSGVHMLCLIFTDATPPTFTTSGNVLNIVVPTLNQPTFAIYDSNQKKYYVTTTNLT